ncbi:beta-galactosidase [Ruminococcus sp. Marseille-P6503]|uniref:beta-galactosidase n=1 Tax=Ruminococcus sp. Marseille-P6503 TaxID=2364796 RepID=UPI000F542C0C|nr:beta-galactosidase [Ruminococcus sp. Marseille-P6503]
MAKIGVDYYPEHWDESLWEQDAELMAQTGVKVVRMAEFAWSRLEPKEGVFDFGWLDRAVELFASKGIEIILCTPTNCPPLWLYEKYPDALQTERSGQPIATGIRGHRCYNSPSLRKFSERIIRRLTERYGSNPAVTAWQIDNELDAVHCCCPECTERFRKYLKEKYGSLESINKAFGSNVWSGEYSAWTQIKPPLGSYPLGWYNPSYMLEWHRFCQKSVNDFVRFQAELIRETIPEAVITTNTWLCENAPDFYKMSEPLDVVSYDNYPPTRLPDDPDALYSHAFHLDLMRGIKRKNFWIMEQLSGAPGCWMPMTAAPKPEMIKGYALQAIARGADSVVHFRWRSAVSGAEMFWHGLIDQSNVPSRRFYEFAQLCREAEALDTDGTEVSSDIALLYSPDTETALKIQPQTDGFHYYNQLKSFHDGIISLGANCDIISQSADFSGYSVIIAPTMFITDESVVKRLYSFAENGGTVVLTNRSGVKDQYNNCIMAPLPAAYSELTGCTVQEFDPIGWDAAHVEMNGREYEVSCWCDVLKPDGAAVIASYTDRFYKGSPAVTVNSFGRGKCYYVGTIGKRDFYKELCARILSDAGLDIITDLPRNVELSARKGGGKEIIFIFNNNDKEVEFSYLNKKFRLKPFEMKTVTQS